MSDERQPVLCWSPAIEQLIDLALEEDLGRGDITTDVVGASGPARGAIVARQRLVCCGVPLVGWLVERSRLELRLVPCAAEGQTLERGELLASLDGPADRILRLERTALNFLQRLSGVATRTRAFVDAVAGTPARVVDTRKTLPGWRSLDKYAVRVGGGGNHRFDLGSGILIKDNHVAAAGSVGEAVRRARRAAPHPLRIEAEVDTLEQLDEALAAGAEAVLLDNMAPANVRQAVARIAGRALVEVSGGVTLETVRALAEAGAQIISVGGLTHSAPAVDISLELRR